MSISVFEPIAKPILIPARLRDFENVPVISRFSYFFVSGTEVVPPKSQYASSMITTQSPLYSSIFSTNSVPSPIDVGALGFGITTPPFSAL